MMESLFTSPIIHFQKGKKQRQPESRVLIDEGPLTIQILGGEEYTIMRTPGHDRELAVGFLFTEGAIDRFDEILMLDRCAQDSERIRVWLRGQRKRARRSLPLTSSCGLCGRQDIDRLVAGLETVGDGFKISAERLYALPRAILERQILFQQTGGSHSAALFNAAGEILILYEDVGRHNALDKVLGHALACQVPLADKGIYLSGRTSLEMIVKAARARVSLVAAASAPTGLAVQVALRVGITLCGFVRGQEIAVYSHDARVESESPAAPPARKPRIRH